MARDEPAAMIFTAQNRKGCAMTTPQGMLELADELKHELSYNVHSMGTLLGLLHESETALRQAAAPQGREAIIEECAKVADDCVALANLHYGIAESVGAHMAARKIRTLALIPAVAPDGAGWAFAKELSNALLKIRPLGGSELFVKRNDDYYADPEFCGKAIEELHRKYHAAMKEAVLANRALAQAQEPGEDKPAAVPKGFKPVYVKRWRTLIVVSEAHADKVREALAPPPQVDSGREERAVAVLREMLKAYDAGSLQMSSPEIGEPENDIPYHPWHEELLHNAREVVALRPERSGGRGA